MKKIASIVLFSILFGFLQISQSFACSCMAPGNPIDELNKSDLVFQATVEEITDVDAQREFWKRNKIDFSVDGIWKGSLDKPVYTQQSSAACGFNFQKWWKYVVYAWEDNENNSYNVNICSRTTTLENASDDISALWDFISTSENDNSQNNEDTQINLRFIIIGFILIFGLGFLAFLRSNKNK